MVADARSAACRSASPSPPPPSPPPPPSVVSSSPLARYPGSATTRVARIPRGSAPRARVAVLPAVVFRVHAPTAPTLTPGSLPGHQRKRLRAVRPRPRPRPARGGGSASGSVPRNRDALLHQPRIELSRHLLHGILERVRATDDLASLQVPRPRVLLLALAESPQYVFAAATMRCASLRNASTVRYHPPSTRHRSVDRSIGSFTTLPYPGSSSSDTGTWKSRHCLLYRRRVMTSRRNMRCCRSAWSSSAASPPPPRRSPAEIVPRRPRPSSPRRRAPSREPPVRDVSSSAPFHLPRRRRDGARGRPRIAPPRRRRRRARRYRSLADVSGGQRHHLSLPEELRRFGVQLGSLAVARGE